MAKRPAKAQPAKDEGWKPPPHGNAEAHQRVMERMKQTTPAEALQSLVDAGIFTPDGRLTAFYRDE